MRIPHALASILTEIAEQAAIAIEVPMAVAVTNDEGKLRCFLQMDGALPASGEIAIGKAYTAAVLRMATHELGRLAQPGGELYGIQHTHGGRIVLFGGGFPLRLSGRMVGGIGISGGTVEQDMRVAGAVIEALQQMERWAETITTVPAGTVPDTLFRHSLKNSVRKVMDEMGREIPPNLESILTGVVILAQHGGSR
jgi:uncharacterized protein GlcG (DUF336 family)